MYKRLIPFTSASLLGFVIFGLILASPNLTSPRYDIVAQDDDSLEDVIIYFAEENGESTRFDRGLRGVSRYGGFLTQLNAQLFTLEWNSGIPADADILIIPGPIDSLSPDQIARLWLFINNGGRVLMAVDGLNIRNGADIGLNESFNESRGFFELAFPDFGLRPLNAVLVAERATFVTAPAVDEDNEAGEVPVAAPNIDISQLPPYVADGTTTSLGNSHPILQDVEGPIYFNGARPIEIDLNTPNLEIEPLVFSDSQFFGERNMNGYFRNNVFEFNIGTDITPGEQPIFVAMENATTGARLVLLGDVDLMTNRGGFQSSPSYSSNFVYPANVQLMLNATTWLADTDTLELTFNRPAPTGTPTMIPSPTPTPTPEPEAEGEGQS